MPGKSALADRTRALIERKLPSLLARRKSESLPIRLDRRRIYVLPTRFGLFYGFLLLVLLIASLNYNNNPGLLATFLLVFVLLTSVFSTFRCMDGLRLEGVHAERAFAGEPLQLTLAFANTPGRRVEGIRIEMGGQQFTASGSDRFEARVHLSTTRRGWIPLGHIRIWTDFPFSVFRCWSWLRPDLGYVIYPRPEAKAPPLPRMSVQTGKGEPMRGDDDLRSLREYRPGDALRSIAWKSSARRDEMLVRELDERRGSDLILDYSMLTSLDLEARISRLARWALDCHAQDLRYRMVLPGKQIGPARGRDHLDHCLRELALFNGPA